MMKKKRRIVFPIISALIVIAAVAVLGIQTLADVDDNRMRRHDLRQPLCRARYREGRHRQHDQIRFGSAGHVGRNLNTLRNDNTRQQLLVAVAYQRYNSLLAILAASRKR